MDSLSRAPSTEGDALLFPDVATCDKFPFVPNQKRKSKAKRKGDKIDLSELNPEDFVPVSPETMGKSLRKAVASSKPATK